MYINWLEVYNFRLLKSQKIDFNNRISVINGLNGQGKTSLLEAIYFLSQAKSFRTSKSKEIINWENIQKEVRITGKISTALGSKKITYNLSHNKKTIEINDKTINKPVEFYGQFRAIEITPADAELVAGSSQIRRKFIDRLLAMSDASYITTLLDYQRTLKNRNAIFTKNNNLQEKKVIFDNVSIWNEVLIEDGFKLFEKRKEFIRVFNPIFTTRYHEIAGEKTNEIIFLKYKSRFFDKEEIPTKQLLKEQYLKAFDQDFRQKTTTFGVHRDDMQIYLNTGYGPKEAKQSASQGQVKNISLALKLAANDYITQSDSNNELPVLLLDDIESELDENRRRELFTLLSLVKNQVIIATTKLSEASIKALKNPSFFVVQNGQITPEN